MRANQLRRPKGRRSSFSEWGKDRRRGGGRVLDQARSKRSAFITLVQAATKSLTNFASLSSWA